MIGIIFDCDGTLVDSEAAHFLSWQKAMQKRGFELFETEYAHLAGNTEIYVSQKLHESARMDSAEEILLDKKKYYKKLHAQGIPPIERMILFVNELVKLKRDLRIKLAVASAAPKDDILANLSFSGIIEHFDAIVSGADDLLEYNDPDGVNKPKPYIYLHAAKKLSLSPSRCVAFEDSLPGVFAATSAGIFTYAVPNSFTWGQDFSKADIVIPPSQGIDREEFFQTVRNKMGEQPFILL